MFNTEVVVIKKMEPQMGIEPTSQPWQGRVLTIVLLRHLYQHLILYQKNFRLQLLFYIFLKIFLYT